MTSLKKIVAAKLHKDATVKAKAVANKLIKKAMAGCNKMVAELQKAHDELADLKVSSEVAVGERACLRK